MNEYWDLSGRDVVPELGLSGAARDVGAQILYGMLLSDAGEWKAPYETVRKNLKIRAKSVAPELQEQADQRFRTYKTLFRGLGLLYDHEAVLHRTDVGSRVLELLESQYKSVDDYGRQISILGRKNLAHLVAPVLARYQLDNPLSTSPYPPGTDVHPLVAIWRTMRALDNKLHWEEMGRVLTTCLRDEDVPAVITKIRESRLQPNYDLTNSDVLNEVLGPRRPDAGDNQSDRLDVWFSRAGFKNLLIEPRDRSDGFRHLNKEFLGLIDKLISRPVEFNSTNDPGEYVRWLGQVHDFSIDASAAHDDQRIDEIVRKCRRYGGRQIIALVGPAGTGKTRAARMAALTLADGQPDRIETIQFHAGFTYEEFMGGLAPADGGFKPKRGALLEINDRANADPNNTFVLVIDELSRADLANVLGELLTYIEYRDQDFKIPIFDNAVSIAPNLIILATLNPSDRSVINMDDAMIRRIRQVKMPGDPLALRAILHQSEMEEVLANEVIDWFSRLPDDAPFGHGVFVGARTVRDLHELWYESLQYFLYRGGLAVYPDPDRIEGGFIWRMNAFKYGDSNALGSVDPEGESHEKMNPDVEL